MISELGYFQEKPKLSAVRTLSTSSFLQKAFFKAVFTLLVIPMRINVFHEILADGQRRFQYEKTNVESLQLDLLVFLFSTVTALNQV